MHRWGRGGGLPATLQGRYALTGRATLRHAANPEDRMDRDTTAAPAAPPPPPPSSADSNAVTWRRSRSISCMWVTRCWDICRVCQSAWRKQQHHTKGGGGASGGTRLVGQAAFFEGIKKNTTLNNDHSSSYCGYIKTAACFKGASEVVAARRL